MDKIRKISHYGWVPDYKDFLCAPPPEALRKLPDNGKKIVTAL